MSWFLISKEPGIFGKRLILGLGHEILKISSELLQVPESKEMLGREAGERKKRGKKPTPMSQEPIVRTPNGQALNNCCFLDFLSFIFVGGVSGAGG